MPIFEYKCKKCKAEFELLARASEKPRCPKCGSENLEKLISGFSAGASKGAGHSCGDGGCCGEQKHVCGGGCGCGHKHG